MNIFSYNFFKNCSYFSIVDNLTGIQVYNYEGRHQSSPKYQGLRPEFITSQTYAMSDDTIAIIDKTDEKCIYIIIIIFWFDIV